MWIFPHALIMVLFYRGQFTVLTKPMPNGVQCEDVLFYLKLQNPAHMVTAYCAMPVQKT